jgi:hypothetical protein
MSHFKVFIHTQNTHFNICGLLNVRISCIIFRSEPKINVGPKALHKAGSIEARYFFLCFPPAKSTFPEVFLNVALGLGTLKLKSENKFVAA